MSAASERRKAPSPVPIHPPQAYCTSERGEAPRMGPKSRRRTGYIPRGTGNLDISQSNIRPEDLRPPEKGDPIPPLDRRFSPRVTPAKGPSRMLEC